MKILRYLLFSILTASALACHKTPISQEETVRLIIQILYTEQQINREISLSALADTCLIYEAILQKKGYTQAQFQQALRQHLRKPEQFRKALDEGKKQVRSIKSQLQAQLRPKQGIDTALLKRFPLFRYLGDSLPQWSFRLPDSLVCPASLPNYFPFPDTLLTPLRPLILLAGKPLPPRTATDFSVSIKDNFHTHELERPERP